MSHDYQPGCNGELPVAPVSSHTTSASPERVIESVAYDTASKPYRGCSVRGSYLKDSPNAWIEVTRDGKVIRGYEYPAYRIWNVAAHFNEYVDDLLSDEQQDLKP